jgi:hypothetical protein
MENVVWKYHVFLSKNYAFPKQKKRQAPDYTAAVPGVNLAKANIPNWHQELRA